MVKSLAQEFRDIEDVKILADDKEHITIENTGTKTFNFKAIRDAMNVQSFEVEKSYVNGDGNIVAMLMKYV